MKDETSKRSAAKPSAPDRVHEQFPDGAVKLFTKILPASEEGGAPCVLIEGDKMSLEYLGKLILAQAAYPLDCGFSISPRSAGNAFFKRNAEPGIGIHRLPCMDPTARKRVKRAASRPGTAK